MKGLLKVVPIVFYFIVGIISLAMALKNIFSSKYLPFHEKAAKKQWNQIGSPLQVVILSLLRLAGLGFLIISILLMIFSVVNYFIPNTFYKYSIPGIGLIYCVGLFIINYLLYKKTKADSPWKESLFAMFIILAGIIISIFT